MIDLAVSTVVLAQDRVLLIEREDLAVWGLPGGQVESGESIANAAIREVEEETGITVKLLRLVGIYSRPAWFGGNHSIIFLGAPIGGTLRAQPEEALQVAYFALDKLPELLLWWHRQPIQDAVAGYGNATVWTQQAAWPMKEITTRAQFHERRRLENLPLPLIRTELCREVREGDQQRDLAE